MVMAHFFSGRRLQTLVRLGTADEGVLVDLDIAAGVILRHSLKDAWQLVQHSKAAAQRSIAARPSWVR